ncbi:MAG: glutamine amidotransferase, partial [Hyphomicrobium sp.]
MCGIVGLFIKDKALEPRLGELTAQMLATMCERGPDSAGFAVYGDAEDGKAKLTVQSASADQDFAGLDAALSKAIGAPVEIERKSSHAV